MLVLENGTIRKRFSHEMRTRQTALTEHYEKATKEHINEVLYNGTPDLSN